jgi:hypothetical protein
MNHVFGCRDHFGPSCHPSEVVSRIGLISFNRMGVCLANERTRFRSHLGERVPVICIKYTIRYMFTLIIASLERCRITTTEYPGYGSPWATSPGLNNPDFSCVDGINCHLSANATSQNIWRHRRFIRTRRSMSNPVIRCRA